MRPSHKMLVFVAANLAVVWAFGPHRPPANAAEPRIGNCSMGSCPAVITAAENGKTMTYPVGSRFIFAPGHSEPAEISCSPAKTLRQILDPLSPDMARASVFETVEKGACTLRAGNVTVNIEVLRFR